MAESYAVESAQATAAVAEHSRLFLLCAFDLLAAALPLAVERLRTGGVPMSDQRAFWAEFCRMEELIAVVPGFDELMNGYVRDHDHEPVDSTFYDLAACLRREDMTHG